MSTGRVPWFRVAVEGVVIVASILLAFGIDAWWDGLEEAELERSYLVGMESDFAEAHRELQRILPVHLAKTTGLEELNRLLSTGEGRSYPDSVIALSHLLWVVDPFDPAMPTYENLLASRGPNVVQNQDLRHALRDFESVLDTNRDWDDYLVQFDADLMVSLLVPRLPYFAEIFGESDSGGDPQPDVTTLAGDMTLRNLIAIRFSGERALVQRRQRLLERVEAVQALLATELGR